MEARTGTGTSEAPVASPVPELTPCHETPAIDAQAGDLAERLAREIDARRRAECTARVQSNAVQLALDLLVREPDITGFFRVFVKSLVEDCESQACGVWLLDDSGGQCDLWMAYLDGRFYTKDSPDWSALSLPRDSMTSHLVAYEPGWKTTIDYAGDDPRLPAAVRAFNESVGVNSVVVSPLVLPSRNLGWVALSTREAPLCESVWRVALVEAMARQATLALHQSRLAEQARVEERRKAVLEERNRIARDIHDTLAQGFAAILMQLQAAQRAAPSLPPAVARSLDTAVELARTHMIEARRSVCALRPQSGAREDLAAALQRMAEMARRTGDVPVDLEIGELPDFGGGVEREIIGIAQEALTNAVRHAKARRISIQASAVRSVGFRLSVADDGRGIPKEHRGIGFGMTSMQERAERIGASLTIVTAPRAGTEVVLAWEPPSFSIPGTDGAAS
ncbi:MAG TPA: sensor histidine kinase [Vicinamibacterales bacterium]